MKPEGKVFILNYLPRRPVHALTLAVPEEHLSNLYIRSGARGTIL